MNFDDILIIKNEVEETIETIRCRWEILKVDLLIKEFEEKKLQENFWKDERQADILKEGKKYSNLKVNYNDVIEKFKYCSELISFFETSNDADVLKELEIEIENLKNISKKFKITLFMNHEDDNKNCFFEINSGAGGTEAQDWAEMIMRMYVRFFERNGLSFSLMDFQKGDGAGIKSASIFVKGDYAKGLLESEVGIHRLVRISPFDSNARRHTSFCAVSTIVEAPDIVVNINPNDLRIDTYRAGGAGGQHVNKTDSAVRITHLPTGLVTQCQNERSQLQNKESAMKALKAKLYQREKDIANKKVFGVEKKKIEWGSQIRSYVLHPYKMVKDHRTDFESSQPEKVLDGEIIDFIDKYLIIRD
jgi:peptide chain release factor 2